MVVSHADHLYHLQSGSLFFLGYCLFQVPGAIYAQKNSVKKLIFISLILWGLCAAATGMVSNIPALMVLRLVLARLRGFRALKNIFVA
jgi:MFS family permease